MLTLALFATNGSADVARAQPVPAPSRADEDVVVEYDTCMNACDGTQQRETDRHTCALTCEVVAVTRAEELEPDAMHQALSSISWRDRCYATCAGLSTDDRATCRLTCSDAAVALCGQW